MNMGTLDAIRSALADGLVVPYLGPGVIALAGEACPLPASPDALVRRLTASASVPHKIRNNLTAAAQFIENFKHRKTVSKAMSDAFRTETPPTTLHRFLAAQPALPLLVHVWYDDLPQKALSVRDGWGMVQGVSQAEHFGQWVRYFRSDGTPVDDAEAGHAAAQRTVSGEVSRWGTLLYQPVGSVAPEANFLVSDSDFVEVFTEIDIQTPIPERVKHLRVGGNFLFLGCRFATQLDRLFASQIIKRSSDRHWAVLPEEPTRNEARFLAQHDIQRIDLQLVEFLAALVQAHREDERQPVFAAG